MTDNRIASIVRALAERVDPGRVLRDVVAGALAGTGCGHGLLAGAVDGGTTPLVALGAPYPVLVQAAARAAASAAPVRMSDPALGCEAVAVPVRLAGRVVAALGVAGPPATVEAATLLPYADCAALALGAGAPGGHPEAAGGVGLAEALARLTRARGRDAVLAAALDTAEACFGARSGLVCLVGPAGDAEVAAYRGLDRDRLAAAAQHPDFSRLVAPGRDGLAAPSVAAPTDPVVQRLSEGAEFAVTLPVEAGAVVLLLAGEPAGDTLRALEAYRAAVDAALRAVAAGREVEAARGDVASLVHAVGAPALAVDPSGCFLALNAAAAELFALSEPFELGRPARGRLGHPGLEAMLLGEEATAGEVEVTFGRPEPRRWRAGARRIGAPGDRPGGRLLVLREAPARPPDGESDFVAVLGRELRRPLAAIADQLAAGPEASLAAIAEETESIAALAEQLALLGRADDSEIVARPRRHDVVAVVRAVVDGCRAKRPDRGLIVTAQPARLEATVDARLLERALQPLVDNALRYSDGPVAVEVADRGASFEVAVIDAGPGIFSGDVPGLFERFHPLDGSPGRHGAGLGLYSARRLVEAMEGRIWCDSRLGVGSRFAFRLPHSPAEVLH